MGLSLSVGVLAECFDEEYRHGRKRELAARLGVPDDVELGELDRMRGLYPEILKRPGWERYAGEAFVCKALLTGAEISIRSGCALVCC